MLNMEVWTYIMQIKLDKEKKILSIRDRGIGMTKEDLIKNLGTIAKSGTSGIYVTLNSKYFTLHPKLCCREQLGVDYLDLIFLPAQRLWRKCRQVGISISLDSLGLVSTLCILLRTMLKSLANIMMTNSKTCCFNMTLNWICFSDCWIDITVHHIIYPPFRYVWESKADGAFAVSEDTWNEPLGRGTEIRLHLRDEAGEYLEESKLKVRIIEHIWPWTILLPLYLLHVMLVLNMKTCIMARG